MMFCPNCGTQLPDGAAFCYKCGASVASGGGARAGPQASQTPPAQQSSAQVIAPAGATALKCPSCGAPISPKFGEMVITCEYCGTGITLGNQGWKDIQKHTMLPLTFTRDKVASAIHGMMDKGIFKHHVQEESTLEEMTASYIPYWIIPVSARTTIVAVDEMQQLGQTATQAALMGIVLGGLGGGRGGGFGGGGGGRRRSFDMTSLLGSVGGRRLGVLPGTLPGTMMYGMGMGMGGGSEEDLPARRELQLPGGGDERPHRVPAARLRVRAEPEGALRRLQDRQEHQGPERGHRRGRRKGPGQDPRRPAPVARRLTSSTT